MPTSFNVTLGSDPDQSKLDAQQLFHKTLAAWASEVLQLRARGLDRPCYRQVQGPATPWQQPLRKAA